MSARLLIVDDDRDIRAVLTVQVDTATGLRSDIAAVRAALDAADHPALLMCDSIACLACDDFRMDDWGVDVMVAACQKGLMTPPGLGFVYFNDRADAARDEADCVTAYWDWRPRTRPEQFYHLFGGTAPTHHLYGLREALTMLLHEEGLDAALARHATLARAVWAAFEAWEAGGALSMNVADPAARSHAITALRTAPEHGTRLRDWLQANTGLTLGIGLGMAEPGDPRGDDFFRLGHMGHVNGQMVMGLVGGMEAGMRALGVPLGRGALDAAAEVIAEAGP